MTTGSRYMKKKAKLRWKKGLPPQDGLYWHRNARERGKSLVFVRTIEGGKRLIDVVDGLGGHCLMPPLEFAGPLQVPEPED